MSLAIETDEVFAVLVGGSWWKVQKNSFDLDSFEFVHGGESVYGGGQSGVCATGFTFVTDTGVEMFGPLTAIQAVKVMRK